MKSIEALLLVVGLLVLSALILAIPTMLLWNYVMPYEFGLAPISLFQAMALNILSGILFKSTVTVKKD